jgi:hypothetical protein
MLSVCIDTASEEESAILSARERGFNARNAFGGPGRGSGFTTLEGNRGSNVGNAFGGPGRGSGFTTLEGNRRFKHPGRRVGHDYNGKMSKSAHVVSDFAREHVPAGNFEKIRCHACGALGHIIRFCRKKDNGKWRNGKRGQGCSPTGNLPARH